MAYAGVRRATNKVVLTSGVLLRVNWHTQFSQYRFSPFCVQTASADTVGSDGYGSSQHRILFLQEQWSVVYR